ncbi:D-alanine--D-alanine ligase family protein [Parapedobacter tibetensis]|uniref:D-alanine--D-alanine ligase family protein n=1 Tax=Parapedobacter tibetensis TaxID=2972951 RepID=UPI00214D8B62|nr:D-alanine--D-alanine ligase family protein [Parapedobacter tibetensis]
MRTKKKLALVTGGYTGEWEVSLKSAANVAIQLDKSRYEVYTIYIARNRWYYLGDDGREYSVDKNDFSIRTEGEPMCFDIVFICIHGMPGEDGRLQGYFDMLRIPYTSCGQLAAAITMNKSFTKAIVADLAEVHVAKSQLIKDKETAHEAIRSGALLFPLFIKPNTGGSSIGMSRVDHIEELPKALDKAFAEDFGEQIIMEEFIAGREISVGVYRDASGITVLPPSEVKIEARYFDFETKYHSMVPIDITPAPLTIVTLGKMQRAARAIFDKLSCKGVVRIDFILQEESDDLFFLEVNTIPGQTNDSFVPKQLRAAGIDVKQFFNHLVDEALNQIPV